MILKNIEVFLNSRVRSQELERIILRIVFIIFFKLAPVIFIFHFIIIIIILNGS